MKKVLMLFFVLVSISMIVYVCVADFETKYARKLDLSEGKILGIFYLGGYEEYNDSVAKKYYSATELDKFPIIECGGDEKYLIVPKYDLDISVYVLEINDEGGGDKTLAKTINTPFILKCNMSDIFPNSEIKFKYKSTEYVYTPCISLKDGSVVTKDFVMLITE